MFQKVIVAEDLDTNNIAVIQALETLVISEIEYAKYCDDALLKIKKATQDQKPFELLITDLSFIEDHRKNSLNSGEELIKAARQLNPNIKIIVFSVENKSYRIQSLFEHLNIDGFVAKGRNSIPELKKAIEWVYNKKERYIAPEHSVILHDKTVQEIDNYDIQLIKQLSYGVPQESMDAKFLELGITPNSKSTIEKRISKLKIYFKANNPAHLVSIAKDLGLV
ncbi:response regulator [Flavobacterium sp.]|uniref:response regulator n=1 Tax=Flavobacterium sp. TaxID=239 RepID=UPI00286DE673|nr:response regulator [Flavobacterium sp.]